jgi:DNA-binding MarR family transcriptional regulator
MADIESIERGNLIGVRQTDIAARIGVTQQLVSHHIRSLERLDWLMRKGRGRKVTMHLTIAGLDVLGRIRCDDETPNYQKQPPMDLQVE